MLLVGNCSVARLIRLLMNSGGNPLIHLSSQLMHHSGYKQVRERCIRRAFPFCLWILTRQEQTVPVEHSVS